jgi:hypothetical protein
MKAALLSLWQTAAEGCGLRAVGCGLWAVGCGEGPDCLLFHLETIQVVTISNVTDRDSRLILHLKFYKNHR